MRSEVIEELTQRIEKLKLVATPNDIATGMSGSFARFNASIESATAMTTEEFKDGVYDDYLRVQHNNVLKLINV